MDWAHAAHSVGRAETVGKEGTAGKEEMEGKADAENILSLAGDASWANNADLSRTSTLLLSLSGDACGTDAIELDQSLMSCCSNLKERCLSSSWNSALADPERRAPGMDMAGTKDKAETGDMGETADREDRAGKGDREALRPRRNSNSRNNDSRNIRRDGGHNYRNRGRDRRDNDDNDDNRDNGDNGDAFSCQPPDETSTARASRDGGRNVNRRKLSSPPGIGEGRCRECPIPVGIPMPSAALIWGCS